ncbi:MAG TPA: CDP-alcohol phosphatidyltransferase family protein, partial [Isosphaeraceae bacterium]|nr:CDP-alcohol phosphatidyltransferase family protein [Isosphaeraceae bacterium]
MAGAPQERFWNVPNALTVSRLVMAVAVFALIAYGRYTAALGVFGIAAITDALDGYFARLLNQSTVLGRQLDPLVDKVIVCGGFIYLLTIEGTGLAPWMVTAVIVRELLIQGLRSFLENQGEAFGARMAGKVKTTFQCLSICAILLCLAIEPKQPWLWARDL